MVHVQGAMSHKGHSWPVNYAVHADKDPAIHDQILKDYHQRGVEWVDRKADFQALEGTRLNFLEGSIEIRDCNIQFHGQHDFKLYVGWDETSYGITQYHSHLWHYTHPAQVMPVEQLMAWLNANVNDRMARHTNLQSHSEALNALTQSKQA